MSIARRIMDRFFGSRPGGHGLPPMTDIHCHILPGVDDGAESIDVSVEMARIAVADGIGTLAATPHVKDNPLTPAEIDEHIAALRGRLAAEGIPLDIRFGADVNTMLMPDEMLPYALNKAGYILIEFPHQYLPGNARDTVFRLMVKGMKPIITHPERNGTVMKNPDAVLPLVEAGALVQITAGSLTGHFGAGAQSAARRLLKAGAVHVIASDAHSTHHRAPVLSGGYAEAARIVGEDAALALVTANPEAIVNGLPL